MLYLYLGHLADAFVQSDLQPFRHTLTHRRRSQPITALQEHRNTQNIYILLGPTFVKLFPC